MASKSHETLHHFCEWQEQLKNINKKNRTIHHDVGVFLTRYFYISNNHDQ